MDFKKKYLKYKNKYLELKGGNKLLHNQEDVGGWSGDCACPNGQVFKVGDNHDGCGSLACVNGTSGECIRGDFSGTQRKLICEITDEPTNLVEKNLKEVGGWSGDCTCPDGSTYKVGDNNDSCGSLACVNGTSGQCIEGNFEGAQTRVTCATGQIHANYWKKKIKDRNYNWMRNKLIDGKVLGLENLNIENLNELENPRLYDILLRYIKKGLCGAKDGIQFPGNVSEVWKNKIKELCVNVHKEYRNLIKNKELSYVANENLINMTTGRRIMNGEPRRPRSTNFNFGGTSNRSGVRGNYPNTNPNGSYYFIPKEVMFLRKMLDMNTINWESATMILPKAHLRNVIYTRETPLKDKIELLFNVGILHHFYHNKGDENKYIKTFTEDLEYEITFSNTLPLVEFLRDNMITPLSFQIDAAADYGGPSKSAWISIGKMLKRFYFKEDVDTHFLQFKDIIINNKEALLSFRDVGLLIAKSILEGFTLNLNLNPYYTYRLLLSEQNHTDFSIDHLTLAQMLVCFPKTEFGDIVNTNKMRLIHLAKLLTNNDMTYLQMVYDDNYVDYGDEGKWPKSILQTSPFLFNGNQTISNYPENPTVDQKLEYLRLFLILFFENDDTVLNKSRMRNFIEGFRSVPIYRIYRSELSVYDLRQLINCNLEKEDLNDLIVVINKNIISDADINRARQDIRDTFRKKNITIRLISELVKKIYDNDIYRDVNINNIRNFLRFTTGSSCVPLKIQISTKDGLEAAQRSARSENRVLDARDYNVCLVTPDGHTCFNTVTIPLIENLDKMAEYFESHFKVEESGYTFA